MLQIIRYNSMQKAGIKLPRRFEKLSNVAYKCQKLASAALSALGAFARHRKMPSRTICHDNRRYSSHNWRRVISKNRGSGEVCCGTERTAVEAIT